MENIAKKDNLLQTKIIFPIIVYINFYKLGVLVNDNSLGAYLWTLRNKLNLPISARSVRCILKHLFFKKTNSSVITKLIPNEIEDWDCIRYKSDGGFVQIFNFTKGVVYKIPKDGSYDIDKEIRFRKIYDGLSIPGNIKGNYICERYIEHEASHSINLDFLCTISGKYEIRKVTFGEFHKQCLNNRELSDTELLALKTIEKSGILVAEIHGDIVPENLIVSNGRFWLTDWEWATTYLVSYDSFSYLFNKFNVLNKNPRIEEFMDEYHRITLKTLGNSYDIQTLAAHAILNCAHHKHRWDSNDKQHLSTMKFSETMEIYLKV